MSKFKIGDRVRNLSMPDCDLDRIVTGITEFGGVKYATVYPSGRCHEFLQSAERLELVPTTAPPACADDPCTQSDPSPLAAVAASIKALSGAELVKLAATWRNVDAVGSFEANLLTLADDLEKA